jgi:ABC-type lipoprotein export system ATPase subunit
MSPTPLLEVEHVAKRYDRENPEADFVLQDVCLQVQAGESLAIVGPSGSGKTTLLNILGALDQPTRGKVLLEGTDLAGASEADLARLRSRRIGLVFQLHHLLPQCTVWENVLVPALVTGDIAPAEERARRLLERVGLKHVLSHRPGQLSLGQRQRAAVVRGLVNRPGLVLADEPTGSLDRATADELSRLLVELNLEENVTLIVVTHSPDLARRMGRVLQLRDGRLVEGAGPP